ncbi:Rieske (2Fe-2S) protein [Planctomycetaceae bacterium]|jgi:nitrite reductase (NADH) small subunit|nr:Rieske (2Fe-2S) protein [Planctomycetaceae bacterium]MDC0273852.1 Rieske (2Fe-2S) protein [Planctomycetaceae bacterium]MDG2388258.1 Rieske (2Fe-2S) protein [Planctomycetaceae bacterium]
MADFQTVAKVGDIPTGEGRAFPVNGKLVGVFLIDEEYLAINDLCPHMGASLSAGWVEEGKVMCPWHAWRFDLQDGTWCDNPKIKTDSYETRVEGDDIQVLVPDAPEPSPPTKTE